jgi:hypothetical protein
MVPEKLNNEKHVINDKSNTIQELHVIYKQSVQQKKKKKAKCAAKTTFALFVRSPRKRP